jgi:hypothetical protein
MGFKDIGEIASRALQKTLEDPEQQKNLISSIAGFVSLPDRSDTSDSAFDLGRFRQFNVEREQEKANRALQAKLKREQEAENLKFRRKVTLEEAKMAGAAKLKELEVVRADKREAAKLKAGFQLKQYENARTYLTNLDKGEGVNFYANFNRDNRLRFLPTDFLMDQFKKSGHPFGQKTKEQLLQFVPFQNYAKSIHNAVSLHTSKLQANINKLNRDKKGLSKGKDTAVLPTLSGDLAKQYNIGNPNNFTFNSATQSKAPNAIQTIVNNKEAYLIGLNRVYLDLFGNPDNENRADLLNEFQIGGAEISTEERKNEFKRLSTLVRKGILDTARKVGLDGVNPDLEDVAENVSNILTSLGDGSKFDSAMRSVLKPTPIKSEDGIALIGNPDDMGKEVSIIDYGLLNRNPLLRAIAIKRGIVKQQDIPPPDVDVVAEVKNSDESEVVTIHANFASVAGSIGMYFQNIQSAASSFPETKKALTEAENIVRFEQFDANVLKQQVNKVHRIMREKGIPNINRYDLIAYLSSQRVIRQDRQNVANSKVKVRSYKAIGIPSKNKEGETTKRFLDREKKTESLNSLQQSINEMLLLMDADPTTLSGGLKGVPNRMPMAGSAAELSNFFTKMGETLKETAAVFGFANGTRFFNNYEIAKKTYQNVAPTLPLSSETRTLMAELEDKALQGQKNLTRRYNAEKEKTEEKYNIFLKKSVLLWKKTALTYKLAGIVQGDSAGGGRTISDTDFRVIYGTLWGGNLAPEATTVAALTNLHHNTQQSLQRRRAEDILIQTTGMTFNDANISQLALNIRKENTQRFVNERPGMQQVLNDASQAGKRDKRQISIRNFRNFYNRIDQKSRIDFSNEELNTYMDAVGNIQRKGNRFRITDTVPFRELLLPVIDVSFKAEPNSAGARFETFVDTLRAIQSQSNQLEGLNKALYEKGILATFAPLLRNIEILSEDYVEYSRKKKEFQTGITANEVYLRLQNTHPSSIFDPDKKVAER